MKHIFFLSTLLAVLLISSCSKNRASQPASGAPSFKWSIAGGATFTADTVVANKGDSMAGTYYPGEIYADLGAFFTPSQSFTIKLGSFAKGNYGDGALNDFNEYESNTGTTPVTPFTVTVTSYSGTAISGTFTGFFKGQTISGSFSNVPVR